ncbi:MAG: ribosome small subunit-dependent GTPase A [Actinomycetota bacterium]
MSITDLETLGWSPFFASAFKLFSKSGYSVGRVYEAHKNFYRLLTENGDLQAKISGKMRHESVVGGDFPTVGDWVVIQVRNEEGEATIQAVLPRFSKFSRKVAGGVTREQVLAANVDTAFLVSALNNDFNVRRMERYFAVAMESGANPVVVLNKDDLFSDDVIEAKIAEAKKSASDVPIFAVSALTGHGMQDLAGYIPKGKTAVFLGSSGVGKSALINALLGRYTQKTNTVREGDDKGRHTTSFQKLIILPDKGMVIDTPGLRELQLWDIEGGLGGAFKDIEDIGAGCKFRDCLHESEPGCAVRKAISQGTVDASRLENYLKLQQEIAYTADRKEFLAKKNERERHISKIAKKMRH